MALLFASLLISPYAHYPGTEIAAHYERWDSAYVRNDTATLADVLSDKFRLVLEGGGTIDKQTYVMRFQDSIPPRSYRTEVLRYRAIALSANVWTKETQITATNEKKYHWYLDAWVKERGDWRLVSSRTLREKHT